MSVDIRLPQFSGTEKEQLSQVRSYLYQLASQLQWALNNVNTSSTVIVQSLPKSREATAASGRSASNEAQATFDSIKSLIIKSAEIVDAYYEEINKRLSSEYIARSDFGTYTQQNTQSITQNATYIEQLFSNIQQITTDIGNITFTLGEVNARIRSGQLYEENGLPVYGLEVGQTNIVDGEAVFDKFARFTADRLSFYDQNDSEVAYISDYKLYIRNVEIKVSFQEGGYKDFIDSNGGIVTKWVGGN